MRHLKLALLFLFSILIMTSCDSRNENEKLTDNQYKKFKEEISDDSLNVIAKIYAEYVVDFHYDLDKQNEARVWLSKYNNYMDKIKHESKLEEDEKRKRIESFGGVEEIKHEMRACNNHVFSYIVNKVITDSAQIAFVVKYLADKKFQASKKGPDCDYPLKCSVFLYDSISEFDKCNGSYYRVLCSISPVNYSGEIYVNTLKK